MFVAEPAVASVVPVSLLVSMGWRVSTRTVDCSLEHERQTSNLLGPPRGGRFGWLREGVSDQLERDPFAVLATRSRGWTRATRTRAWAAERSRSNKASLGARRHVGPMGSDLWA